MAARQSSRSKVTAKPSGSPRPSSRRSPVLSPDPSLGPSASTQPAGDLLDMDQAIALLKTTRPTFYRWLRSGKLNGMKVGRQWRFYRADVEGFLKGEQPRIELRADIDPLLDALRSRLQKLGVPDPFAPEMPPLERTVSLMLLLMVKMGANDFHIEPLETREQPLTVSLRYRIDGVLHPVAAFDPRLLGAVLEQWKIMAMVDVREKIKPQYAVMLIDLPGVSGPAAFRLTFLPAQLGETLTVRLTDAPSSQIGGFDIDKLGLSPDDQQRLTKAVHAPWGLILVAGRAATGKTTTLYSCLTHLAQPDRKILSIEDPVQCRLPGVTQVPVRTDAGATPYVLMRAALGSAPNIVLLSELRDRETLNLVLQCALTGHLMFSTMHTDDAAAALHRLIEIGGDPQVVADAVRLIVGQRLVRVLCPHCSRPDPSPRFLERAADLARSGGLDWESLPKQFRGPGGCPRCKHIGYAGRTVVAETLEISPPIVASLRAGEPLQYLRDVAIRGGMTTLGADAVRCAAQGRTSLHEVMGLVGAGPV